jgi:hypothetical protein
MAFHPLIIYFSTISFLKNGSHHPFFTISYLETIRLSVTRMINPEGLGQHARKEYKKIVLEIVSCKKIVGPES